MQSPVLSLCSFIQLNHAIKKNIYTLQFYLNCRKFKFPVKSAFLFLVRARTGANRIWCARLQALVARRDVSCPVNNVTKHVVIVAVQIAYLKKVFARKISRTAGCIFVSPSLSFGAAHQQICNTHIVFKPHCVHK